jgi:spondin-1
MCVAAIPECEGDSDDSGENLAGSQATVNEQGEGLGVCKTTPWSDWSECSGKIVKGIVELELTLEKSSEGSDETFGKGS